MELGVEDLSDSLALHIRPCDGQIKVGTDMMANVSRYGVVCGPAS